MHLPCADSFHVYLYIDNIQTPESVYLSRLTRIYHTLEYTFNVTCITMYRALVQTCNSYGTALIWVKPVVCENKLLELKSGSPLGDNFEMQGSSEDAHLLAIKAWIVYNFW